RLPIEVDYGLFNNQNFVKSTLYTLLLFDATYPLLEARLLQLRGDLEQAKEKYVAFRKADRLTVTDKATGKVALISRPVCAALDKYATHFLALCHLDQHHSDKAEFMFQMVLKELPEPHATGPYYEMFRWGAQANLGRLSEAKGDFRRACGYYCS